MTVFHSCSTRVLKQYQWEYKLGKVLIYIKNIEKSPFFYSKFYFYKTSSYRNKMKQKYGMHSIHGIHAIIVCIILNIQCKVCVMLQLHVFFVYYAYYIFVSFFILYFGFILFHNSMYMIIVCIIMFIRILDVQLCVHQPQNDSVRCETPT